MQLTTGKELQNGSRFGQLSFDDHEQIVFCDKDTGLKQLLLVFIIRLWDQGLECLLC
jgi:hypothetical protein